MAIKIVEFMFCVCFLGLLMVGLLAFAFCVAHFIVQCIRMFKPQFLFPPTPKSTRKDETTPLQARKVALDFLMERRRLIEKSLHEQSHPNPAEIARVAKESLKEDEFDLDSITKPSWLSPVANKTVAPVRDEDRRDLWALAKFPHGLNKPQWLCQKMSIRGEGLRTIFTASPKLRLTFDLNSARRWAEIIPETIIVPASAAARVFLRRQQNANAQ